MQGGKPGVQCPNGTHAACHSLDFGSAAGESTKSKKTKSVIWSAASLKRTLTAFAGKARSMTALKPLYSEPMPSSLTSSRRTSRNPLGYFPSGAEGDTSETSVTHLTQNMLVKAMKRN